MIVDANVILRALFPDESQPQAQVLIRDHIAGRLLLSAPALLNYELCNAIWMAERRNRLSRDQADQVIEAIEGLGIELHKQSWGEMLPLARLFQITAYDAAYLALAQATSQRLITGDERLYNAVHPHLDWVVWIENYSG